MNRQDYALVQAIDILVRFYLARKYDDTAHYDDDDDIAMHDIAMSEVIGLLVQAGAPTKLTNSWCVAFSTKPQAVVRIMFTWCKVQLSRSALHPEIRFLIRTAMDHTDYLD